MGVGGTKKIERRKNGADLSKLSHKMQQFCLYLAASEQWDLTEAARKAGYAHPSQAATKLMNHPAIRRFLGKIKREREERTEISSDRVWRYLSGILEFDPTEWFVPSRDGDGEYFEISCEDFRELPKEVAIYIEGAALKTLYDKEGSVVEQFYRVKMVSKTKSMEVAAKHALPPPPQRVDVKGADGGVIVQILANDREDLPSEE
jgi:hypothetical protein